jgi:hypothetical protein
LPAWARRMSRERGLGVRSARNWGAEAADRTSGSQELPGRARAQVASSVSPGGRRSPLGGDVLPFGADVLPFGADGRRFRGDVLPFGADGRRFRGDALPFGADVRRFRGDVLPFGADGLPFEYAARAPRPKPRLARGGSPWTLTTPAATPVPFDRRLLLVDRANPHCKQHAKSKQQLRSPP